jgi:AAA+ ATPase superfamily predicted ATPase
LLARFAAGKRALYLYGTRLAERDILLDLATQAAQLFDEPYLRTAPFPSWTAALDYLAERARGERLLIVVDEFPYLCEVTPGLDTLVQSWWDRVHRQADLMLVLAGSGISFMEGLVGARGPLHGRRTGQVEVHPFDHLDAAAYYQHLAPDDRVRGYACFGGVPAYLDHWLVEPTALAETIQRTLLAPGHRLFREGEELLRTEFHQEALYASILRAVAGGAARPSDIARAVGRHGADEIFDHLRRLQELRFLRREIPITEWSRTRAQRALYRLADPYLRFWFRFVSPYQALIQLGQGAAVWAAEIAPALDEFVAATTWEEVVRQHLWRRVAAGALPTPIAQLGRWWDNQDEVDMVGLWRERATLVGECKWTSAPVGEAELTRLRQKAAKLPLADAPLWVLAGRSGFTPGLRTRAAAGDLLLLEPGELFAKS